MAVRNFYATIQNDTHGKPVSTGPIGKDEGFTITIQQRTGGGICTPVIIHGYVDSAGMLVLTVRDTSSGREVVKSYTSR